ncbi:MAG: dTMP kinase [Sulfolobales archaeon]
MSKLIVIEGIDGSGKTTLAINLIKRLEERGFKAYYTYEPYSSPFTEALKRVKSVMKTNAVIDALAMSLDRAYHIETVIKPRLAEGYIVVLDRYYYSTIAYQGAMGADIDWLKSLSRVFIKPDISFYLDVSIETAMRRIREKESRWPEYEVRELLERVREIYLSLVRDGELILVNGEEDQSRVLETVWEKIRSLLK